MDTLQKNIAILSELNETERTITPCNNRSLPSVEAVKTIIQLVKMIVFPGYFDKQQTNQGFRSYHIGVNM